MGRLTHRTSSGWTYFVTTKCWGNVPIFQVKENAEILIAKLPTSLEKAMQFIKGGSSHAIHIARGTRGEIWQSGFHESRVRDLADYKAKADYTRFNPVTAKLVERPELWAYGSAIGQFKLDPIPQGLKPQIMPSTSVGAKAPTPSPAKAPLPSLPLAPGLKPRPPKEQTDARNSTTRQHEATHARRGPFA